MSVTLRMQRFGQKKRPFYRIVATEKSFKRDGRFIEIVGTYNPMSSPATIELKEDRIKHWVEVGAEQSELVQKIVKERIPGLLEAKNDHSRSKIQEKRKQRKARAAKAS